TERMVPCMSGGMSWIASFTDTWLKPQDRQISTTSAAAAASSGRVTWEADVSGMKGLPAGFVLARFGCDVAPANAYAALQWAQMPEISMTGVFGVKPAAREALRMVSATAAAAASPTAPHFSQMRNTTGSPLA